MKPEDGIGYVALVGDADLSWRRADWMLVTVRGDTATVVLSRVQTMQVGHLETLIRAGRLVTVEQLEAMAREAA